MGLIDNSRKVLEELQKANSVVYGMLERSNVIKEIESSPLYSFTDINSTDVMETPGHFAVVIESGNLRFIQASMYNNSTGIAILGIGNTLYKWNPETNDKDTVIAQIAGEDFSSLGNAVYNSANDNNNYYVFPYGKGLLTVNYDGTIHQTFPGPASTGIIRINDYSYIIYGTTHISHLTQTVNDGVSTFEFTSLDLPDNIPSSFNIIGYDHVLNYFILQVNGVYLQRIKVLIDENYNPSIDMTIEEPLYRPQLSNVEDIIFYNNLLIYKIKYSDILNNSAYLFSTSYDTYFDPEKSHKITLQNHPDDEIKMYISRNFGSQYNYLFIGYWQFSVYNYQLVDLRSSTGYYSTDLRLFPSLPYQQYSQNNRLLEYIDYDLSHTAGSKILALYLDRGVLVAIDNKSNRSSLITGDSWDYASTSRYPDKEDTQIYVYSPYSFYSNYNLKSGDQYIRYWCANELQSDGTVRETGIRSVYSKEKNSQSEGFIWYGNISFVPTFEIDSNRIRIYNYSTSPYRTYSTIYLDKYYQSIKQYEQLFLYPTFFTIEGHGYRNAIVSAHINGVSKDGFYVEELVLFLANFRNYYTADQVYTDYSIRYVVPDTGISTVKQMNDIIIVLSNSKVGYLFCIDILVPMGISDSALIPNMNETINMHSIPYVLPEGKCINIVYDKSTNDYLVLINNITHSLFVTSPDLIKWTVVYYSEIIFDDIWLIDGVLYATYGTKIKTFINRLLNEHSVPNKIIFRDFGGTIKSGIKPAVEGIRLIAYQNDYLIPGAYGDSIILTYSTELKRYATIRILSPLEKRTALYNKNTPIISHIVPINGEYEDPPIEIVYSIYDSSFYAITAKSILVFNSDLSSYGKIPCNELLQDTSISFVKIKPIYNIEESEFLLNADSDIGLQFTSAILNTYTSKYLSNRLSFTFRKITTELANYKYIDDIISIGNEYISWVYTLYTGINDELKFLIEVHPHLDPSPKRTELYEGMSLSSHIWDNNKKTMYLFGKELIDGTLSHVVRIGNVLNDDIYFSFSESTVLPFLRITDSRYTENITDTHYQNGRFFVGVTYYYTSDPSVFWMKVLYESTDLKMWKPIFSESSSTFVSTDMLPDINTIIKAPSVHTLGDTFMILGLQGKYMTGIPNLSDDESPDDMAVASGYLGDFSGIDLDLTEPRYYPMTINVELGFRPEIVHIYELDRSSATAQPIITCRYIDNIMGSSESGGDNNLICPYDTGFIYTRTDTSLYNDSIYDYYVAYGRKYSSEKTKV